MEPLKPKKPVITQDGVEVVPGMKLFVYPANYRHGGTIKERQVASIEEGYGKKMLLRFDGGRTLYGDHNEIKLYFTRESALEERKKDKADPPWIRFGKFRVSTAATIEKYLADKTGIDINQIDVCKLSSGRRSSGVRICWADKDGLHKEHLPAYNIPHIKEEQFAPIVAKMKGEQS